MSARNLFKKEQLDSLQPEGRQGFLDELHLPPSVTAFLRRNARRLQIGGICLLLLIVGWTLYGNHLEKQRQEAAAELATALTIDADTGRRQQLSAIQERYADTPAAFWSRLELAHLDFSAGRFEAAAEEYRQVLSDLDPDSSLVPLVMLALAHTYEELNKLDEARPLYEQLSGINGFEAEAYPALGRIHELAGRPAEARDAYRKYLELRPDSIPAGGKKTMIMERLAKLGGEAPKTE